MCLEKYLKSEIDNLAYRFYEERGKVHGYHLDDHNKAKSIIKSRFGFGLFYLVIGIILVCLVYFRKSFVINFPASHNTKVYAWCFGWAMIGAGAGLINTRNYPQGKLLHLLGYWFFIILAISITSFTISLYDSGDTSSINFYSLSALVGLLGGFLGHIFHDLIIKIIVFLGK